MRCRAAARLTRPTLNQGDDLTTSDFHTDLAQGRVAVAGTVTDRPRASLSFSDCGTGRERRAAARCTVKPSLHVQALDRLARDFGDDVEVLVQVKDSQSG